MTACRVFEAKLIVSNPFDPAPLFDTGKPCEFKNFWRKRTSVPFIPSFNVLKSGNGCVEVPVYVYGVPAVVAVLVAVDVPWL
jgi:hypothetical protein